MEKDEIKEENYLTDFAEIYRALQRLIRYAQSVTCKFEGIPDKFSSAITKVDLKNKAFAFDRIIPEAGNELLQKGRAMQVTADFRGILVKFTIQGKIKYRAQSQEYIGSFPEKLLYLQRRNAYRAMVPRTYTVYIILRTSEGSSEFKGRLQDVSGSGFKAYFKGDITKELKAITNYDESTLHVGDESMDCGLDARHAVYNQEKDMTFCGFSFHPLTGMKQRYVENLVNKLQFEEQRKQQAEKERKEAELNQKAE